MSEDHVDRYVGGFSVRENGPAVQLFNLAVRWLHSFLPFLLKKVRPH